MALFAEAERSRDEVESAGPEVGAEPGVAPIGPARQQEHVLTHYYSSRALRRLVLSSAGGAPAVAAGGSAAALSFAEGLWDCAVRGRCKAWLGSSAEKVMAGLLHSGSPHVMSEATKELQPLVAPQTVEQWSSSFLQKQQQAGSRPEDYV